MAVCLPNSDCTIQVLFYSTDIFAAAGVQYSEVATVVVGATLLGFTIVTVGQLRAPIA